MVLDQASTDRRMEDRSVDVPECQDRRGWRKQGFGFVEVLRWGVTFDGPAIGETGVKRKRMPASYDGRAVGKRGQGAGERVEALAPALQAFVM